MNVETIGLLGGLLLSVQAIPQIVKTYNTKSAKDLSYLSISISSSGCLLTFVYGIYLRQLPVYLPVMISIACDIVLVTMKYRYEPCDERFGNDCVSPLLFV